MDSDDVSNSVDDGEIFESLGVEHQGSVVAGITSSLLALEVEGRIYDLERADVSLLVGLVGEGGVDDNCVEVLSFVRCKGGFIQFDVFVL